MSDSSGVILSLNQKITKEIAEKGYTLTSLSKKISVNRGMLSGSLNSLSKPMPISLLDSLAKVFGYPEGWLYREYMLDCFRDGKAHWRRIKSFLIRCLDLQRLDLVEEVLYLLMEDPQHLSAVYVMANELFDSGQKQQAIPLFRCVVENEIKQHSERFAISHYKWFRGEISKKLDLEGYQVAAFRFAPFRKRLPENYQLDALLQLANVYYILEKWHDVEEISREMLSLVLICIHQNEERKKKGKSSELATERHLVVYYGQSFLLRGNAYEKQRKYEKALTFIDSYEDLSWFNDLDSIGWEEVKRFSFFAEGNRLNLYLFMGEMKYLKNYIIFLNLHPEERLPGLLTILETAISYKKNIDDILPMFQKDISKLFNQDIDKTSGYYSPSSRANKRIQLIYLLAVYYLKQKSYQTGIDHLLYVMEQSILHNSKHIPVTCSAWFEKYRGKASKAQQERYKKIMKEVISNAEMALSIVPLPPN
jgi:transcriptional regulator with XRE-family HTH domain